MDKITLNKGEVVFRQGENGTVMYKIVSGTVGIYILYGEAGEKQLVNLEAGKVFGEMAMLEELPRSATAVITEDAELVCVEKSEFSDFIVVNPEVATDMLKHVFGRLRSLTDDYVDACKTLAEVMNEGEKTKKPGLWAKIKKYADQYSETTATAFANESYMNSYLMNHYNMLI